MIDYLQEYFIQVCCIMDLYLSILKTRMLDKPLPFIYKDLGNNGC